MDDSEAYRREQAKEALGWMMDQTAHHLQAFITPHLDELETAHRGYRDLLYPYKPADVAAAIVAAPIFTAADIDELEELLDSTHRAVTMFHALFIREDYDDAEAAIWSMKLMERVQTSIADDHKDLYRGMTSFGNAIYMLDPVNRSQQLEWFNWKQDLVIEQMTILETDLKNLVNAYQAFLPTNQSGTNPG